MTPLKLLRHLPSETNPSRLRKASNRSAPIFLEQSGCLKRGIKKDMNAWPENKQGVTIYRCEIIKTGPAGWCLLALKIKQRKTGVAQNK
jgi:hypothetical protein